MLELIKELQIKSKTVMSWRSQKKKRAFFVLFILFEEHFFNTCVLSLRWPTSVTAKEKSYRQKKNARGKKEIVHGKGKNLPTKETLLRQSKIFVAKKKLFMAKEKSSRQKKNACGKKEIVHCKGKKLPVKEKLPRQKKSARGKKEKDHGKKKLAAKEDNSREKEKDSGKKLLQQKKVTHRKK